MAEPLRILFAEDVPTDHELAEWQLRSEGVVFISQRVDTPSEFSRALIEFKPDLVISDFSMPEFNGMQALQILQRSNIDIPFVMLTGSVNEDTAVMCMKAGASDYVIKEHINKLPFAVKESLKRHAILKEKEEAVQQLRESEAKFRSLFENNHAVMLLVDPENGEIVDANPAAAEFYGYTQVDLLNKRISDINAHSPEKTSEKQTRAATQQTPFFSFHHRLANGEVRDVEVFSGPIRHGGKTLLYSIVHDITARKQAEAALERKNKLQEMMAALGRDLATTLDLKKIYQIAGRHLREMIDCPNIGITLFNAERQTLTAAYAVTEGMIVDPANFSPQPYHPQDARGGRSKAIASKTPVIETHHPAEEFDVLLGERTAIYVPILVEDQVIGLVEIHDLKQTESAPEDGEWLSVVANQIGLAIQNARQYEKTRQRVAELLLLHTIDQTITGSNDPAEIYNKILDIILSQPYSDAADILILNPQNQTLEYAAGRGFFTPNIEGTAQPFRSGLAGKVFTEKHTVEVFDLRREDPIIFHKDVWLAEDFNGYIGLPLILHQQVKGVLEIFTRRQSPAEPGWVHFMESVAQQVSIAVNNSQLFQNLFQSNQELVQAYDATIAGWSKAMDLRDEETEGHTERVTSLTLRIAEAMGIPAEKMEHVRRGALLHDIGKLGVPDQVLLKIGPLTDAEWEIMRKHPVFAYEMLAPIEYLQPALDIPYCHHERWDGTGYPRGLSGEEIPLEARIFALVDVFDALTSDRPYRGAWSKKQTLAYIAEQSGKQFDPRITAAFLKLIEEEPDWSV